MKRKLPSLHLCLYLLAIIFLISGILSLIACHQNITAQIDQGIPIKGNELAILNLYLQSCIPNFAYATLIFLGGNMYHYFHPAAVNKISIGQSKESSSIKNEEEDEEHEQENEELEGWTSV